MFLKTLHFLSILLEALFVFNLLIVVHELGHYLAARWRGMVVEKFAIWFGKPLWSKKINGVEYILGSIPAGGYVALPQMAPMEALEGKSEHAMGELPQARPLDKIIVAFAGPLFSMGLAFVFACVVWFVGRPVSEAEATTTIGYVFPDSPAEKAGLKPGDKILEVDGELVSKFGGMEHSVTWQVVRSEGETIPFKIERAGHVMTLNATPEIPKTTGFGRKGLRQVLIAPAATPMIAKVELGSAADKAGLKRNDLIMELDGRPLLSLLAVGDYADEHPGQPIPLTIQRGQERISVGLELEMPLVAQVFKNSPAQQAGIEKGDRIIACDGKALHATTELTQIVEKSIGKALTLTIQRGQQTLDVTLKPVLPEGEKSPKIGILWDNPLGGLVFDDTGVYSVQHPTPVEQVTSSVMNMVNTIGALLSPKSEIKAQHLGGPVMILRIYYKLFESEQGWRLVLWFSVFLNVNLAVLNMLPFPVLDGGHIVLGLVEMIRRKPINIRLLKIVETACAAALISYMLYVTYYDVLDLPFLKRSDHALKFAPAEKK
jgi:regulator of sigma E protease